MSNLPLKALVWEPVEYSGGAANDAQGAGIYYRAIERDGKHMVFWVDSMGGSDGDKSFDSLDELKDWVQIEHYPHKMRPYVVPDFISINEQLPEQNTNVLVLYHAHFDDEEVTEFDICTAFFRNESFDVKDQNFYTRRKVKVVGWKAIDAAGAFKAMRKPPVSKQGE